MAFTWLHPAIIAGLLVGIIFAAAPITISNFLAPRAVGGAIHSPYECGLPTFGPTWVRFGINYSIYALLFLSFEVVVLYLFPMAVWYARHPDLTALCKVLAFLALPAAACAFFIRRKVFLWPRRLN